jgi:hypothetical protein
LCADGQSEQKGMTRREALGRFAGLGLGVTLLKSYATGQSRQSRSNSVNPAVQKMTAAAQEYLNTLSPQLKNKAMIPFDAWEERSNWHFIPTLTPSSPISLQRNLHERRGVSIREMNYEQRLAAHALLHSALSTQGYLKATGIMFLEEVLRATETALGTDPKIVALRDPELYFFTIFGKPSEDAPWGWRVEGHHLSLHFASPTNELVATTPMFMGTNPAVVSHGTHAGASVLAAEGGIARELLKSLNNQQLAQAIIEATAPQNIVTGNSRKVSLGRPVGIPASKLIGAPRELLIRLVQEYINNWRSDFADRELKRITSFGVERIHFAWAGSTEPGKPHYYRIHSPKLLIEYDNTQDNVNHIHTVYRDLENDFGIDMLRQHYKKGGHHD